MKVFRHIDELPADFGPTVVSVGNFDGAHRAHRAVLEAIVKRALALNAKSLAVTFEPHPARILRPEAAPKLITPMSQKIAMIEASRVDGLAILDFNRDLSLMSPRDFAHNILKTKLRAIEVHEGFNFRFGHRAQGDVSQLANFGEEFGFALQVYPEMRLRGHAVSSSSIRKLLEGGRVSDARHL